MNIVFLEEKRIIGLNILLLTNKKKRDTKMSLQGPIATHRMRTGIPTGRLAVWWVLASEIFIFGGLIMCFLLFKFNNAPGFEDADMTSTAAGAFNTFVLLTSS